MVFLWPETFIAPRLLSKREPRNNLCKYCRPLKRKHNRKLNVKWENGKIMTYGSVRLLSRSLRLELFFKENQMEGFTVGKGWASERSSLFHTYLKKLLDFSLDVHYLLTSWLRQHKISKIWKLYWIVIERSFSIKKTVLVHDIVVVLIFRSWWSIHMRE